MSDASSQDAKRNEFLALLPLTAAIAGLPTAEIGKYFNEDQMELRARAIKSAYSYAQQITREIVQK